MRPRKKEEGEKFSEFDPTCIIKLGISPLTFCQ